MTVSNTEFKKTYEADGIVSSFPITFIYVDENDIKVYLDDVLGLIDFTILSQNVEFIIPPEAGVIVTIVRETPRKQLMDFQDGSKLRADTLEYGFDNIIMMIQEITGLVKGDKGDPGPSGGEKGDPGNDGEDGKDAKPFLWNAQRIFQEGEICSFLNSLYVSKANNNEDNNPSFDENINFWTKNDGLGTNQTWTEFSIVSIVGSEIERQVNTIYTNSTNQSILIHIILRNLTIDNDIDLKVDENIIKYYALNQEQYNSTKFFAISFLIPVGSSYELSVDGVFLGAWWELR